MRLITLSLLLAAPIVADVSPRRSIDTVCLLLQFEKGGAVVSVEMSSGRVHWTHALADRPTLFTFAVTPTSDVRPRVTREHIFVVDNASRTLIALSPRTGRELWSGALKCESRQLYLEADGEHVLVSAYEKAPVTMFTRAGRRLWEAEACGNPVFAKDHVYVSRVHGPNKVYALDRTSGELKWEQQHGGWPVGWDGSTLYYGSAAGLLAFDPTERAFKWKVPGLFYSAAVFGGKLYANRAGAGLIEVDLQKGAETASVGRPGAHDGDLIEAVGSAVACLDMKEGALEIFGMERRASVVRVEIDQAQTDVRSVVAFSPTTAFVANAREGRLEAFDTRTGARRWRCEFPRAPVGLVYRPNVVLVAVGRKLCGVDANRGRVLWERELAETVTKFVAGVDRR